MTPREELLRDFDALVDNYHASRQETRAMLNQYAIGRWVPVEERLPELKGFYWSGYMIEDGITKHGIRSKSCFKIGDITHWLELDLPEVEQ